MVRLLLVQLIVIYDNVQALYYVLIIRLSRTGMCIYKPLVWNMSRPENEALKS